MSPLLSSGCTPHGASIIAFGLGYLILVIVWLYAKWREYYCLWPGLSHLCYRLDVRRMARVLLPLAWAISSLLSYGCTPYGASIIAFDLGYVTFVTVLLYAAWREDYCLWPGLSLFCYPMAVRRVARVLLPLAWAMSPLLPSGCTLHGASIIAFGLGYLIFVTLWLYAVWREYCCLWHGLSRLFLSYGCTPYGASIIAFGLGYLIFGIARLYAVRRTYYCLWPGLSHLLIFLIVWLYALWCKKRS